MEARLTPGRHTLVINPPQFLPTGSPLVAQTPLLKTELAHLLQRGQGAPRSGGAWGNVRTDALDTEAELLIGEFFVHAEPIGEFNRANNSGMFDPSPGPSGQDWLMATSSTSDRFLPGNRLRRRSQIRRFRHTTNVAIEYLGGRLDNNRDVLPSSFCRIGSTNGEASQSVSRLRAG